MIKAVVFDLDDTLISEYDYIKSGYSAVSFYLSEKYDVDKKQTYDELLHLYHNNGKMVFNRWLELHSIGYTKKEIMELVNIYRTHIPQINFLNDVIPCIKFLKRKGMGMGIISDGYLDTQKKKIYVLKADDFFDKIILTDELGKDFWKPNIAAFEMMKNFFGISYEEMMYVGDNPQKDFYMKKDIPIKTVRVKRENGVYVNSSYRDNIKEDYFIEGLSQLKEILDEN